MMSKRKNRRRTKVRYDKHHIIPKSRGGKDKTIELPVKFHRAWHTIFGNLYGEETVDFIVWLNHRFEDRKRITEIEMIIERALIKKLFKDNHKVRR